MGHSPPRLHLIPRWGRVHLDIHLQPALTVPRSSMGLVGSAFTLVTAAWPQRAAMAAPVCRAGGDVMFPWADTAATKKEAARAEVHILKVGRW